jgi:hypothetical protein
MEHEVQPELSDILEMLKRYVEANKRKVCFVGNFVAFKNIPGTKCKECGDECDCVNEKASRILAYGDKETLRMMLNDLRDTIEDESNEEGFVNL